MRNQKEPNVFLSWSGEYSKSMAESLYRWIPRFIPNAQPWMSSEDIGKGTIWTSELNARLASCKVGIIVLTPDNLNVPWLNFEAGALFKAMPERLIATLLCGLEGSITGPLGQFQKTELQRRDVAKLFRDINSALPDLSPDELIEYYFNTAWSDFETETRKIHSEYAHQASPVRISEREILEEVLATVRPLRRAQDTLEQALLSKIGTVVWYRPFSFDERLSADVHLHAKALPDFLKLQMRTPEKAERLLAHLNLSVPDGTKSSEGEVTHFEDLEVTFDAIYSRGLDGHYINVHKIWAPHLNSV